MEFFGRHPHDRLPSALQQCVSLALSQASIPEICQKCDHFAAFTGASAKYLGERNGVLANKRGNEWKKERLTMHVSLCDGGYLLKALGSVAHYLADGIFYSTNDKYLLANQRYFLSSKRQKSMPLDTLDRGLAHDGDLQAK